MKENARASYQKSDKAAAKNWIVATSLQNVCVLNKTEANRDRSRLRAVDTKYQPCVLPIGLSRVVIAKAKATAANNQECNNYRKEPSRENGCFHDDQTKEDHDLH